MTRRLVSGKTGAGGGPRRKPKTTCGPTLLPTEEWIEWDCKLQIENCKLEIVFRRQFAICNGQFAICNFPT
jgi:hypothetical protein